jgi:hypothetical protein
MTVKHPSPEVAASPVSSRDGDGPVKGRLARYLTELGVTDSALLDSLADEAMHRARRQVAPGSAEELLRRSLEELQRRFDNGVSRMMNLASARTPHDLAAGRAAFLLDNRLREHLNSIFHGAAHDEVLEAQLRASLPQSTPHESPMSMRDQEISFFFSSTPDKKV